MKAKYLRFFCCILVICCLAGCSNKTEIHNNQPTETSLFAMNTYMDFTVYGENAHVALHEAENKVRKLEVLWSVTNTDSEVYQANHSGGKSVIVSDETVKLVSFTLEMSKETNGALEPTLYPVLTAWGFTTDTKQVPAQEQIDTLLPLVDYSQISLDDNLLTVPQGMKLDFGAVGKGYAADFVTEALQNHNVKSAILSFGGNIQAIGSRPDGTDWHIGIRAPWEDGNLGVLEISNAAVVTSGGHENFFKDENGTVYWHILDPVTGYPAHSGLQAVTIVSPQGRLSDALSTALFVMGTEKAEEYWREHGGFDMLLVTEENEIILTEGIADRFVLDDGRSETVQVLKQ